MNRLKFSVLSFFVLGLLFFTRIDAATPSSVVASPAASTNSVLVADVDIYNAKIVSQEGNKFKISFTVANGKGVQNDVKYGVNLFRIINKTQFLVDEKVYDESIDLIENTKIDKEVEYIAPSSMTGEYKIILMAKNKSGFPFSFATVGEFKLTATKVGIEILTETCSLQVVGEKSEKIYRLTQGVDISKEENIQLTCTANNSSKESKTVTPSYQTRYRSSYGEVVGQEGGDINPIPFKALEKKTISLILPKAISPQAYNVEFSLRDEEEKSNSIIAHYVIRGASSTIQNISLDKNYYKKGELASVSFYQTLSADNFPGSRYKNSLSSTITTKVEILNGKNEACAQIFSMFMDNNTSPKIDVSLPITSDCLAPKVIVTATAANGTVLDQKEFNINSAPQPESKQNIIYILSIMIVIIIVGIIIYLYLKQKNNKNLSFNVPMNVLSFLFLSGLLAFVPGGHIEAKSFSIGTFGGDSVIFVVGIDKEKYAPGEDVNMDGTMYMASCGNTGINATLDGEILGEKVNLIDVVKFSIYSLAGGDPYVGGSNSISAPARENTYLDKFKVVFTGKNEFDGGAYQNTGTVSIDAHLVALPIDPPIVVPVKGPIVNVSVNYSKEPEPVEKNSLVDVTWSTSPDVTSCDCSYIEDKGVKHSCGSGEKFVGPNVISSPSKIKISRTTTFSVVCTDEVKNTVANPSSVRVPPSIVEIVNTGTVGGTRIQAFRIGDSVMPGDRFSIYVYSHIISVTADADDKANDIMIKLRNAVNSTTATEWNDHESAPKPKTPGFKPTTSRRSDNELGLVLNYQNQFGAYVIPAN